MRGKPQNTILQEIKVLEESELLTYLIKRQIRKSRSAIKSLLTHKQIRVNNQIITQHNFPVHSGDTVSIHRHDPRRDPKKLNGLTIVYEDKDLLIVDKQSGLLSVAAGAGIKETAYKIVNSYVASKNAKLKPYILFRLDRETSGLMVFAKSTDAQEKLQSKWKTQPPLREYIGIVEGVINPENSTIKSWLTENKNYQMFSDTFDNGGQIAITHYKTIAANNRFSAISITMDTARKNQARVQLQSIGHPILGDKKYGSKLNPLKRIALHANKVVFNHPTTNEKLEFETELPKKMQILLETIQLKNKNAETV